MEPPPSTSTAVHSPPVPLWTCYMWSHLWWYGLGGTQGLELWSFKYTRCFTVGSLALSHSPFTSNRFADRPDQDGMIVKLATGGSWARLKIYSLLSKKTRHIRHGLTYKKDLNKVKSNIILPLGPKKCRFWTSTRSFKYKFDQCFC